MGLRKAGGNWVEGNRFFDREVEIEALIERVEDGAHSLVTAQRRMGKTSLVRELLRRLAEGGDFYGVALELLTEAAVSGGQLTDDSIRQYEAYRSVLSEEASGQIRDVLHVLEHDGYLARHDEGYRFVSGLVEDWWRARNSRGFVPFNQRQT